MTPNDLAAILAAADATITEADANLSRADPDGLADPYMAAYHAVGFLLRAGVPPSWVARLNDVLNGVAHGAFAGAEDIVKNSAGR